MTTQTRTEGGETIPPRLHLLDETGTLHEDPLLSPYVADVDLDLLKQLYRSMARARRVDQEATSLQRQGQLVLWVPMRGQEAAQVGSVFATEPTDRIFPSYREHAVVFERGVKPSSLLRLFRGVTAGGWDPDEHHLNLYTMVLAAQVPHAVGYAMGAALDRKAAIAAGEEPEMAPEAVIAYYGDGASTEGEIHESMVFAASYDAPVLFFVQNNQWAISVPFSTQSRVPLATRAAGYGFEGLRVDGNDVLGVLAATRYALEKIRNGEGPVMIEAETYRMGAHTTADDPTKYRHSDEEKQWAHLDPVERLEAHLRQVHGVSDEFFEDVTHQGDAMAAQMREEVLAIKAPTFEEQFAKAYAEPHSLIDAERTEYLDYHAGFAPQDSNDPQEGASA